MLVPRIPRLVSLSVCVHVWIVTFSFILFHNESFSSNLEGKEGIWGLVGLFGWDIEYYRDVHTSSDRMKWMKISAVFFVCCLPVPEWRSKWMEVLLLLFTWNNFSDIISIWCSLNVWSQYRVVWVYIFLTKYKWLVQVHTNGKSTLDNWSLGSGLYFTGQ